MKNIVQDNKSAFGHCGPCEANKSSYYFQRDRQFELQDTMDSSLRVQTQEEGPEEASSTLNKNFNTGYICSHCMSHRHDCLVKDMHYAVPDSSSSIQNGICSNTTSINSKISPLESHTAAIDDAQAESQPLTTQSTVCENHHQYEISEPVASPKICVPSDLNNEPNSENNVCGSMCCELTTTYVTADHRNIDGTNKLLCESHCNFVNENQTIEYNQVVSSVDKAKSNSESESVDSVLHDLPIHDNYLSYLKNKHHSVSQAFDREEHFSSNVDFHDVLNQPNLSSDLDKGWAWVVLVAAVLANVIVGGSCLMSGIVIPAIVDEVDPDLTKASWISAVHLASLCFSGPLAGATGKKLGIRITVCLSGIVITLGFVAASFSNTVGQLIVTHGVIAGFADGFAFNSVVVIVGQYFCKYRGLACGLLAVGAGFGMLFGGVFVSFLLDIYGLDGAYMLWAGVVLHLTPLGMLFRPPPEDRSLSIEYEDVYENSLKSMGSRDTTSGFNSMLSGLNSSWFGSGYPSMMSGVDRFSNRRRSSHISRKHGVVDNFKPLLKTVLQNEITTSRHSVFTNRSHYRPRVASFNNVPEIRVYQPDTNEYHQESSFHKPSPLTSNMVNTIDGYKTQTNHSNNNHSNGNIDTNNSNNNHNSVDSETNHSHVHFKHCNSKGNCTQDCISKSTLVSPVANNCNRNGSMSSVLSKNQRNRLANVGSRSHATSHISLRSSRRGNSWEFDNESISATLVSTLRPRDAVAPRHSLGSRNIASMMGSVASFPTSLAMIKDDLSRIEKFSTSSSHRSSVVQCVVKVLDSLRLLRNKPFLIFLVSNFLFALGESPILTYLPSYAMSRGTDKMQASFLFTSMGIGSMVGRFLGGLVSGDKNIGPVILHAGCLGIEGLLVAISPLITSTVVEQMVFAGVFGIYSGAVVPIYCIITIDLLGIGDLGIGVGFLCMMQGVGYLAGPPLAGFIVSELGYSKSFLFAGFTLIAASFCTMFMSIFLGKQEDDEDDEEANSLDELEKVLQKISDYDSDESEQDCSSDEDEHINRQKETEIR